MIFFVLNINYINLSKSELFLKPKNNPLQSIDNNSFMKNISHNHINTTNLLNIKNRNNSFSTKIKNFKKSHLNFSKKLDENKLISLSTKQTNLTQTFYLTSFNHNEYEIYNSKTGSFNYYNISTPYDKHQIAKNIICTNQTCNYPNVCLSESICGCDNHFANFPNYQSLTLSNINVKLCSYRRKSPVIASLLEIFIPGAGLLYSGNIFYGIVKLLIGLTFFILVIIKVHYIYVKKQESKNEEKLNTSENEAFNKQKKERKSDGPKSNLLFNVIVYLAIFLIAWLYIDFILIGMRITGDGNGVGYTIYQNYGNI